MMHSSKGRVFLLTGLSGAGKSTLGRLLVEHLNHFGARQAYLIDGDYSRAFFDGEKSFDPESRAEMTRRMAFGAKMLVENNTDVIMANIAGAKETRDFLRRKFPDFIEIYMKADLKELRRHDVKGVYKKRNKSESNIVGLDLPYDEPVDPDVVVHSYKDTPEEGLTKIIECLAARGPIMGTKADTLESLKSYLMGAMVLSQVTTTWSEFQSNPAGLIDTIFKQIGKPILAVRSSCRAEDSKHSSNAGAFDSILNVRATASDLRAAIKRVRDSYRMKSVPLPDSEQILIQEMVEDVATAGVICSRYEEEDSPYMVINFDDSGRTDAVTAGEGGTNIFVSRFTQQSDLGRWRKLVSMMRKLEELFPKFPLEVEFAEKKSGEIVLLQCRPLNVRHGGPSLEQNAVELIEELKLRFERAKLPHCYIPGNTTVLSDMADWNPSEMIGDRPSTLAYSLYRELITDRTWHEARSSQGYFNVVHANLMMSMARKPYIDTRASFASLTPASISDSLREKIVEGNIAKLRSRPELHDKIEFEVAYSCLDCSTEKRIELDGCISPPERDELIVALRDLTNTLIGEYERTTDHEKQLLLQLEMMRKKISQDYSESGNFWENFQAAYLLLEPLRTLGILPFSRLARLGFIARSLMFSLVNQSVVESENVTRFFETVPTVASNLRKDFSATKRGELSKESFAKKYGHLRMSTYDITSKRYDQMLEDLLGAQHEKIKGYNVRSNFEKSMRMHAIEKALDRLGLGFSANHFLAFAKSVTQLREEAKFLFTKSLSDVLEYFAKGGEQLGLTRSDLKNATVATLLRFRNPEFGSSAKAAQYLRNKIDEKAKERSAFELIRLPSVLTFTKDIEVVQISQSKPNFISSQKVTGEAVLLSPNTRPSAQKIEGKIAVIENADPGFDWIFGAGIIGLVTKYGGVASHMAVRCAEFGMPGAIGCGDALFEKIKGSSKLMLDCAGEVVYVI